MYLILCVIFFTTILLSYYSKGNSKTVRKIPPGPPWKLPIVGHLPFLGPHLGKSFLALKKIYGPIILVKLGSFETVVITDAALTKEAFSNPAFCGKPQFHYFKDGAEGKGIAFCEGSEVYEQRQFVLKTLKEFGFRGKTMEESMQREISDLLQRFEEVEGKTVKINGAFDLSVLNSFWACLSGQGFEDHEASTRMAANVSRITDVPGFFELLSMFVPILSKLVPNLSGFNGGLKAYQSLYAFIDEQIIELNKFRVPNQPLTFTEAYLDKVEETTEEKSSFYAEKNFLPKTFGDLFIGAIDTSSTNLEWTLAYLSQFLDKQLKLQKEIFEIIGNSRVPSLSDRPSMPYTEALISEIQRMTAITPIGIPHRALEDTFLGNYLILKDTMLISNIYGTAHDPDVWGDPEAFRPERFIDEHGKLKKTDSFLPFGTGKRVCPGKNLARDQLFLYITSLFQRFSVNYVGHRPHLEGRFGFIVKPDPFQIRLSTNSKIGRN